MYLHSSTGPTKILKMIFFKKQLIKIFCLFSLLGSLHHHCWCPTIKRWQQGLKPAHLDFVLCAGNILFRPTSTAHEVHQSGVCKSNQCKHPEPEWPKCAMFQHQPAALRVGGVDPDGGAGQLRGQSWIHFVFCAKQKSGVRSNSGVSSLFPGSF